MNLHRRQTSMRVTQSFAAFTLLACRTSAGLPITPDDCLRILNDADRTREACSSDVLETLGASDTVRSRTSSPEDARAAAGTRDEALERARKNCESAAKKVEMALDSRACPSNTVPEARMVQRQLQLYQLVTKYYNKRRESKSAIAKAIGDVKMGIDEDIMELGELTPARSFRIAGETMEVALFITENLLEGNNGLWSDLFRAAENYYEKGKSGGGDTQISEEKIALLHARQGAYHQREITRSHSEMLGSCLRVLSIERWSVKGHSAGDARAAVVQCDKWLLEVGGEYSSKWVDARHGSAMWRCFPGGLPSTPPDCPVEQQDVQDVQQK